jgi:hypothetical protein
MKTNGHGRIRNPTPIILCHPETQVVREDSQEAKSVTFTVQVDNPPVPAVNPRFTYQWQRLPPGGRDHNDKGGDDWEDIHGATSQTYTIRDVTKENVALFRVKVVSVPPPEHEDEALPSDPAVSEPACLLVYTRNTPITVYGSPKVTIGSSGSCPGVYAGYVNFKKGVPAWGWVPDHSGGIAVHKATDITRQDTKVEAVGYENDILCSATSVTTPHPGPPPGAGEDTRYRFTIYFPNNVPTAQYPIRLDGFCQ